MARHFHQKYHFFLDIVPSLLYFYEQYRCRPNSIVLSIFLQFTILFYLFWTHGHYTAAFNLIILRNELQQYAVFYIPFSLSLPVLSLSRLSHLFFHMSSLLPFSLDWHVDLLSQLLCFSLVFLFNSLLFNFFLPQSHNPLASLLSKNSLQKIILEASGWKKYDSYQGVQQSCCRTTSKIASKLIDNSCQLFPTQNSINFAAAARRIKNATANGKLHKRGLHCLLTIRKHKMKRAGFEFPWERPFPCEARANRDLTRHEKRTGLLCSGSEMFGGRAFNFMSNTQGLNPKLTDKSGTAKMADMRNLSAVEATAKEAITETGSERGEQTKDTEENEL